MLAVNDGEAVEIERLLHQRSECVFASVQRWGATWAGLEPSIQDSLRQFRKTNAGGEIIGIELGGTNPYGAVDIDHHRYGDDDRSNSLSSLEQVAARLPVKLDHRQQLVAANDRGFIAGMEEMGATVAEVRDVRAQDLAAQGVTPEQQQDQRREVETAMVIDGRYLVTTAFDPPTALSDLLYQEKQAREWLIRGPHVWSYSGPRHKEFAALPLTESHWSGGRPQSGYFGIENPGEDARKKILNLFEG